jgi:hypothetical protein
MLAGAQLHPGARSDGRLMAALAVIGGGGPSGRAYSRQALAHRCVQLLTVPGGVPVQTDLRLLAASAPEEDRPYYASLLHHYSKVMPPTVGALKAAGRRRPSASYHIYDISGVVTKGDEESLAGLEISFL